MKNRKKSGKKYAIALSVLSALLVSGIVFASVKEKTSFGGGVVNNFYGNVNLTQNSDGAFGGNLSATGGIQSASDPVVTVSNWDFYNVDVSNDLAVDGATTLTGSVTFDTSTLYVDATNNRVGIGTTSPDVLLAIGSSTPTTVSGYRDAFFAGAVEIDGAVQFDGAITTASTLALGGTASTTGSAVIKTATINSDTGSISFGDENLSTTGTLTAGGGIRATSTLLSTATLLASDFDTENVIDYTPNVSDVTVTLPASSTLSSFIPTAGQTREIYFNNATSTSGIDITIAGGTGTSLYKASSTVAQINAGKYGVLKFVRETDTDIAVMLDVFDQ